MSRVDFVGYGETPVTRTERSSCIPDDCMPLVLERIQSAPAGKSAIFVCGDNLQAIKVADRLRQIMGSGYVFHARRSCVYASKRG